MINGAHIVVYSKDAEADRAFFKAVLQFPFVDVNKGWLMFKLPPAEVAMQGWGRLTRIKLPGGGEIGLYQPRHERP